MADMERHGFMGIELTLVVTLGANLHTTLDRPLSIVDTQ
jgi:hypothetical protein